MLDAPLLSRNSPSRAVSRSSSRQRHDVHSGTLSAVGSSMISSSLNSRRRKEARINIRNARRSHSESWTKDNSPNDVMSTTITTTVLGFEAPDSEQNTRFSPVFLQFLHAELRHTAPPIVNTSKIHVHGSLHH